MTDMIAAASANREAVKILAQNGNWRRALAVHHAGGGRRCESCGQHCPCTIARLASAAQEQVARTAAREARAADRAARAGISLDATPGPTGSGRGALSPTTEEVA